MPPHQHPLPPTSPGTDMEMFETPSAPMTAVSRRPRQQPPTPRANLFPADSQELPQNNLSDSATNHGQLNAMAAAMNAVHVTLETNMLMEQQAQVPDDRQTGNGV